MLEPNRPGVPNLLTSSFQLGVTVHKQTVAISCFQLVNVTVHASQQKDMSRHSFTVRSIHIRCDRWISPVRCVHATDLCQQALKSRVFLWCHMRLCSLLAEICHLGLLQASLTNVHCTWISNYTYMDLSILSMLPYYPMDVWIYPTLITYVCCTYLCTYIS